MSLQAVSCWTRRRFLVQVRPAAERSSTVRSYRGEAGPDIKTVSAAEEQLLEKALPRSAAILARHVQLPDMERVPTTSLDPREVKAQQKRSMGNRDDLLAERNLDIRRKRLIYRAKQRGWLEVDLLLGTWASEHVPTLSLEELDEFEHFVNEETIDIYNIITLRVAPVPKDNDDSVVHRIQAWARANPLGKADPDKYRSVKSSAKLI